MPNFPCLLNIIEPWEFGTYKSIVASIVGQKSNQFLIQTITEVVLKGDAYSYFLAELRVKDEVVRKRMFSNRGIFPVNMIYSKSISLEAFEYLEISKFRSNFMIGEIIVE